jgi:hypothetical protein
MKVPPSTGEYPRNAVTIGWQCLPADFCEDRELFSLGRYELFIRGSSLRVAVPTSEFDATPGLAETLDALLRDTLAGIQLYRRQPYELTGPNTVRVGPNGHQS